MASNKAAAPPQEDAATPPGQPPQPPQPPVPVCVFKKKLDGLDVTTEGVLIEDCCDEMKTRLAQAMEEERFFFFRVIAQDPLGNFYILRFANHNTGIYAVFRQWENVVKSNYLREGDTVECWGNFVGEDVIRATLRIRRKEQESPEKPDQETAAMNKEKETPVEGQIPVENRGPESEPDGDGEKQTEEPAPEELDFLFEKKLDYADVKPGLDRLVFTLCSEKLKTALEETPSISVSVVDPNNNDEYKTPMQFTRYVVEDMYALCNEWRQVVAGNALKVGDSIIGYGNDAGGGEYRVKLYILRERKDDEGPVTLLLFKKDHASVIGRVVINSMSDEEAVVVFASEVEMEGYDEDEGGNSFARFSVEGENGVKYEWSEEADEDGFSKSEGGAVVEDGEVRVKIDVYKGHYY